MNITVAHKNGKTYTELKNVIKVRSGMSLTSKWYEGEQIKNAPLTSDRDIEIIHEGGRFIIAKGDFVALSIED